METNNKLAETEVLIKEHLDKIAAQDVNFAEKYTNTTKTIHGCVKFITNEARKQQHNGTACIADEVVYGWAVHYFQEDTITEDMGKRVKEKGQEPVPVRKSVSASARPMTKKKPIDDMPTLF